MCSIRTNTFLLLEYYMSIYRTENGEWMNDLHGLLSYDGEYKVIVDDSIDDCDTGFEILECHGRKLIEKQHKIQEKALVKFSALDHSAYKAMIIADRANASMLLHHKIKAFCKRNKKVLPTILYADFCYR